MKILITSAALLLVSTVCRAQLYQVSLAEGGGVASCGSGTGIAANYIVTNSHVVDHRAGLDHQVTISGNGINCAGKVIAVKDDCDLAIVRTSATLPRAARLGSTPKIGQAVTLAGITSGTVRTQVIPSNGYLDRTFQIPVIELQSPSVPGDSGGGIFDDAGNLVAINWGCTNNHAHAVSVAQLRQWLPDIEAHCGGPLGCQGSLSREARQVFIRPTQAPIAGQQQAPAACPCAYPPMPIDQPMSAGSQQPFAIQQPPLDAMPQAMPLDYFAPPSRPPIIVIIR